MRAIVRTKMRFYFFLKSVPINMPFFGGNWCLELWTRFDDYVKEVHENYIMVSLWKDSCMRQKSHFGSIKDIFIKPDLL